MFCVIWTNGYSVSEPFFPISLSFSIYRTLKMACATILQQIQRTISQQWIGLASWSIYRWIGLEETKSTKYVSRSSKVKLKVTRTSKLEFWPFPKRISSWGIAGSPNVIAVLYNMDQWLRRIWALFFNFAFVFDVSDFDNGVWDDTASIIKGYSSIMDRISEQWMVAA